MPGLKSTTGCLALVVLWLLLGATAMASQENVGLCHSGFGRMSNFDQHVRDLRQSKRYSAEKIRQLVARAKRGGAEFYSSQIVIHENISGSGTYDLRLFHGIPGEDYRSDVAWNCERENFPIVYFIGFRVVRIDPDTITVAREQGLINVISLKSAGLELGRRIGVRLAPASSTLCEDLGAGCIDSIFYGRYEY